jgi:hypothetical protein
MPRVPPVTSATFAMVFSNLVCSVGNSVIHLLRCAQYCFAIVLPQLRRSLKKKGASEGALVMFSLAPDA